MIQLQLLGSIGLVGHDGSELRPVLAQPKRVGLLAYLALAEPEGFHRRDILLALFWPELGDEEARRALRQALHFLRQHLGPDAIENRGNDDVALSRIAVTCDAWSFEQRLAAGEDSTALSYYKGDLLAGFHVSGASPDFEEWLDRRRTALRRSALLAARRAAEAAAKEGQADQAEEWARLAVEREEAEDSDLLRLLRLLQARGDGTAALAAYDSYARRQRDRFGTEPGAPVRDLVARIRVELSAAAVPDQPAAASITSASPSDGSAAEIVRQRPVPWRKRLAWAGLSGLVILLVGARLLSSRRPASTDPRPPVVAVAILANQSGDTALDRLGIMSAEWISRGLTRVPSITVLDLNALYTRGRTPSGEPVDPMTLARVTRSAYVIGGGYYRIGRDSLAFAAQVLDGTDGRILRTVEAIRGPNSDPIPAIDELGSRLASAIQSIVDPRADLLDLPVQPPPRYDAFREFVTGAEAFWNWDFEKGLVHALRATRLDTSFTMASVFATAVAVTVSRCDLVDSIAAALANRMANINEFERTTLGMSQVRCRRNWQEGVNLQRRRLQLQPHSPLVQWTAAMTMTMANRPSEALAIYRQMDPGRDLAWQRPAAWSAFYGGEADAHHILGDFTSEQRSADALTATGANPLHALYLKARSAVARGDTAAVRAALDMLPARDALPRDIALADDFIGYMMGARGWVRMQIAAELAAHGHPMSARALAQQTAEQLRAAPAGEARSTADDYALGLALFLAGKPVEAQSVFEELVARDTASMRMRGILGVLAVAAGDRETAKAAERWLASRKAVVPAGMPGYYLAAITAARGDIPRALDLIETLPYGAHPNDFILFHVDPVLAPLRGEARFQRFLQPR